MARLAVLSNGSLSVGLNEHGLVHDFYYPYVGLDNLTTARSVHHKIGVWVDGRFSWVDDGTWDISVDFRPNALISQIAMRSDNLNVELQFQDFVDTEYNVFCREITVTNHSESSRTIRLFMHQVFEISRAGRGDTALYEPSQKYILDYKGRCALIIYGQDSSGNPCDQFAVGNYGIEGKEGTFKDAEDGELSGSPVEHAGVDSVLRFNCQLDTNEAKNLSYWVIASDSQYEGDKIHQKLKEDGLIMRLDVTADYWGAWLATASNKLHGVNAEFLDATKKSLLLIKSHCDRRGGVIASCDSSIYNYGRDYYSYVWPRDGAYAMWPLIKFGYTEEPKKFFEFCRDILTDKGYLMHKYQPDRAIGSTWHPLLHDKRQELAIQEDETAIVVFMLGEYYKHTHDTDFVQGMYATLIRPAANFLASFIDKSTNLPHASYDLWEEKFATHTYTVAITYRALLIAADFATKFEYPDDAVRWTAAAEQMLSGFAVFFDPEKQILRKSFLLNPDSSLTYDSTLDMSSVYGVHTFGYEVSTGQRDPNEYVTKTIQSIESFLLDKSPSGGLPRYENDNYFQSNPAFFGNPWLVTTLWLAQYYISSGNVTKGKELTRLVLSKSLSSGVMSEQINPTTSQPVSVAPLVWSHAEFLNTVLLLSDK
jgi:GH15 family glucan-1,4-alpha-glucosidase